MTSWPVAAEWADADGGGIFGWTIHSCRQYIVQPCMLQPDAQLTLTFESPPAVANRYCLPPAIKGPFSLDSSSSFAIASRRLSWVAGSGWKSQEYTACVSCHLVVSCISSYVSDSLRRVGLRLLASRWTRSTHEISSTLGLISPAYGSSGWKCQVNSVD